MLEELEPVQGVRQDFLSAPGVLEPCQGWGLLHSCWRGRPEGWAPAGSVPFKCALCLLLALGPLPQWRRVLK